MTPSWTLKLRSQLLDVFIISSDFDLAQHLYCSMKTVECGQIFIPACRQLRKRAQHNSIGQFKNLSNPGAYLPRQSFHLRYSIILQFTLNLHYHGPMPFMGSSSRL